MSKKKNARPLLGSHAVGRQKLRSYTLLFMMKSIWSFQRVIMIKGNGNAGDMVCQLKKSMYGLRQAPRVWYADIDDYLCISCGFVKSKEYLQFIKGHVPTVIMTVRKIYSRTNDDETGQTLFEEFWTEQFQKYKTIEEYGAKLKSYQDQLAPHRWKPHFFSSSKASHSNTMISPPRPGSTNQPLISIKP